MCGSYCGIEVDDANDEFNLATDPRCQHPLPSIPSLYSPACSAPHQQGARHCGVVA